MTRLRSLLFVPGNQPRMLEKALAVPADVLTPDMEDSVPRARKEEARAVIGEFLPRVAAAGPLVLPRVNALGTEWFEEDVAAVTAPGVYGISIGKVESPGDVSAVSMMLARCEARAGLPFGTLKLVPWIETARAIVRCHDICRASSRIVAVAFGAEDFTRDMGIERLDDEAQLAYARAQICTAARAADVAALDTPYFTLHDPHGLRAAALAAKHVGFKGKFAIHPEQIDTINDVFAPSAEEIAYARRVVAAFEEAELTGRASTSLDGRVIDVPVARRARALLGQIEK